MPTLCGFSLAIEFTNGMVTINKTTNITNSHLSNYLVGIKVNLCTKQQGQLASKGSVVP